MEKEVTGQFITINGERFYEIAHYDQMQPFFISLASDTDLWMYLSSTGGLTAGRRSPGEALFPYYTDDKITENYETTGPRTVIKVQSDQVQSTKEVFLWRPFSEKQQGVFEIERKIAKATVGNKIVFCEENKTLGLRFSYIWAPAGRHGWVRRATLENLGNEAVEIEMTDGLMNVLPAGVERKTQNEFSTLVDGYKKTEVVVVERPQAGLAQREETANAQREETKEESGLGLFRMEAILVDRAEPSESLTCNTVYALGLPAGTDYSQTESKGVRGAFVAETRFVLSPKDGRSSMTWYNVCDVSKDAVAVRELMRFIAQPDAIKQIEAAMAASTETLKRIVAQNDGVQETGDEANDARHFANVLFNTMRGGYYLAYPPKDVQRNDVQSTKADDIRHEMEYLPLTFGRRHGDPSRPWNLFDIRVQDEEGKPVVAYQGNWRDIFQNWEALSVSYPLFINHIIAKFLNATTADGYNPYRITDKGIDWEVIEPENPWSNIGYWGDHQIIYLEKLLELSEAHDPQALQALLNERVFAFANVPYRLKSYEAIKSDPKNSISFDEAVHQRAMALAKTMGADGKLVMDESGKVMHTTMADKLLITLLAKLSNFIPGAGIWMNTLRPEWNDANNALVGYGASMVTLCYMRRYVAFLQGLINEDVTVGKETAALLRAVHEAVSGQLSAFGFIEAVGKAGEAYRTKVYAGLSGEQEVVTKAEAAAFLTATLEKIDASIRANKRADGMYEAYNLIRFTENDVEVSHLYPMLEGQVAVLSSGLLSGEEAADLLDAMRASDLYREDQRSYMLYPNRKRKTFLELNNLSEEAKSLPVVQKYIGTVLKQDCEGGIHFDARYRNANELPEELKDLYEQVFNHHAFTGRSGTFYKYEGLGCIYWHMVSKLLLAVGEVIGRETVSLKEERPQAGLAQREKTIERLKVHYAAIREGIGSHKQPAEYGSFPFDAYSHTPSMAGVQQPGMTGQVKEDILSRWFELGVTVKDGQITFAPMMLSEADFKEGELRFSYCGVQVVYKQNASGACSKSKDPKQSSLQDTSTLTLSKEESAHVFARDGQIREIIVEV